MCMCVCIYIYIYIYLARESGPGAGRTCVSAFELESQSGGALAAGLVSEGVMIRLETLVELEFLDSSL